MLLHFLLGIRSSGERSGNVKILLGRYWRKEQRKGIGKWIFLLQPCHKEHAMDESEAGEKDQWDTCDTAVGGEG